MQCCNYLPSKFLLYFLHCRICVIVRLSIYSLFLLFFQFKNIENFKKKIILLNKVVKYQEIFAFYEYTTYYLK